MILAALFISGREWLLPASALVGVALLFLLWAYRRAPVSGGVRASCFVLKLLGLLALAACLLEPLWSDQRARPGANYFALLADNSQGMQIKDRGASRSRGEFLHGLLGLEQPGWQSRLEENFQVRRYLFDSRLQSTKDFSELLFDGRASSMGTALRALAERYKGQPLAGILLLTDGNATDLPDGTPDLTGLPPIYPVEIGTDDPIKDIALTSVKVTQTAFEDAPVSLQADVNCVGYTGANIMAQLVEVPQSASASSPESKSSKPGGKNDPTSANRTNLSASVAPLLTRNKEKVVAELTQRARNDGEPVIFRFQLRPEKSGVLFYRLRVGAKEE